MNLNECSFLSTCNVLYFWDIAVERIFIYLVDIKKPMLKEEEEEAFQAVAQGRWLHTSKKRGMVLNFEN